MLLVIENISTPIPCNNTIQIFMQCTTIKYLNDHFFYSDLDICFVGVPIDGGTCNRPGARFGPRHIRNESVFIRPFNLDTGNENHMDFL